MKHWIKVTDIRLYAHHGCMAEERSIGSEYRVEVKVKTDFSQAMKTDELKDAIDYVKIYSLVEREMKIPSNLLEHVAYRIYTSLEKEFPELLKIQVKVTKKTPPINGDVGGVSVEIR